MSFFFFVCLFLKQCIMFGLICNYERCCVEIFYWEPKEYKLNFIWFWIIFLHTLRFMQSKFFIMHLILYLYNSFFLCTKSSAFYDSNFIVTQAQCLLQSLKMFTENLSINLLALFCIEQSEKENHNKFFTLLFLSCGTGYKSSYSFFETNHHEVWKKAVSLKSENTCCWKL